MREVTPVEMAAITRLAAANPDLVAVERELAVLRGRSAALLAPPPLRPASFREVLKGLDARLLSRQEARNYLGLPERRGALEGLLAELLRPLQVVALAVSRQLSVARRAV